MPNVINRLKTSPLLKIDKENENKDVKRKTKVVNKERVEVPISKGSHPPNSAASANKIETVWERLSKAKKPPEKVPSNENLQASNSHYNLHTNSAHRFARVVKPKKPLTSNTSTNQNNLGKRVLAEKKSQKRFKGGSNKHAVSIVETMGPRAMSMFVEPAKAVQELLTARSMCHSKSSSDGRTKKSPRANSSNSGYCSQRAYDQESNIVDMNFTDCSDDDRYELAPMMSVPSTRDSLNVSAKIVDKFKDMLGKRQTQMSAAEISIIKNTVKTDDRHRQLHTADSSLFKDILKTQLQEILKHESVVKSALTKIDSSENVAATVAEVQVQSTGDNNKKPQVDVIFKNVPTLEKEIIILKALGEKLEATLKRTANPRNITFEDSEPITTSESGNHSSSIQDCATFPRRRRSKSSSSNSQRCPTIAMLNDTNHTTLFSMPNDMPHKRSKSHECKNYTSTSTSTTLVKHYRWLAYDAGKEQRTAVVIRSKGVRQQLGCVNEFVIERRSLNQLKEDASRQFYLLTDNENELKRTTFKKLKENPDVLMRHLKPKDSMVPFNILDQDPIFFNSYMYTKGGFSRTSMSTNLKTESTQKSSADALVTLCEGGDSTVNTHRMTYQPHQSHQSHQSHGPLFMEEILSSSQTDGPSVSNYCIRNQMKLKTCTNASTSITKLSKTLKVKVDVLGKQRKSKSKFVTPVIPIFEAPVRGAQRRKIRRNQTPLGMHGNVSPKNSLIRTVLVGTVQLSIFILLIMAITYPDIKC